MVTTSPRQVYLKFEMEESHTRHNVSSMNSEQAQLPTRLHVTDRL